MTITAAEQAAMSRALTLAATPDLSTLPNPRVGCVLLADDGTTVAEGFHRGAGTPHAEVDALSRAGGRARGATAVVTLEPCNHTGRTGACSAALIEAGVRRVVHAQSDPNPIAAGGAASLTAAGIEVVGGVRAEEARALNRRWSIAVERQRPFVTWKLATTLDGRSAAADGTSRWITSPEARHDTHRLRAEADTMLVGTRTVEVDDPELTVRDEGGEHAVVQPLRAVMGLRDLPPEARVLNHCAETVHLRTRDPREALDQLWALERCHVLLEGGPTLAAAFLSAGLVDEIVAYVAPVLLGAGSPSVADLGIHTITDAERPHVTDITVIPGDVPNVRLTLTPQQNKEI
ncbi:bifunctional diaminohydroxyphosphoribosylaminopyrimidine deaminase/5-amino-6-(5-phosphoribosylamino)uracil reductase RibD [Nocardioides sp. Kera G14]|uniref:bifunctional diaminohydroxyphosphoribosylaminopyrimidine deaminase/5-amino-6-(5-phosphoribosylamino)uracil reductase RibD n=1 Tax=Nocardioides sp. Kera G14 TaxID=2884264 RepID=UPI001D11B023|nr:bifunctional diaminohydroxyphosphoribosylaminopyrimidine deaminase/5-amino-6-(5-phosphoribosylamino)uracil reductase RibD [Nocardioides sp. Kera G14]UDY25306.1 bifunctional diaminohydroxyphosphoribosylaminopyrimidine deaminase/5-amino-6-(5-phosphoribosylamino)uracil reductase RibD [Nocardioides sp. Kera G14]